MTTNDGFPIYFLGNPFAIEDFSSELLEDGQGLESFHGLWGETHYQRGILVVGQGFRLRAAGSASLGAPPDLAGSGKMFVDHINAVKARSIPRLFWLISEKRAVTSLGCALSRLRFADRAFSRWILLNT